MVIDKNRVKKILIIKFGGIGDLLLTTPVFPNLRGYFPDAEIYVLTLRKGRDVLIDNPYLKRVFTYDPTEDKSWCLIKNIRKQKYDLIIDLYCNPRTALITFLSGAKYRFGFEFRGRSYAYNIKMKGRGGEVHNVDFNLDALRKMDIPITSKQLILPLNVVHREFAEDFIKSNNIDSKPILGISLTGGWEAKRYKMNDYIELIRMILNMYNINIVLLWGNDEEKKEAEEIHAVFKDRSFIIPDSPIKYLGAIIERCDAIIGNDSGPLHLAVSTGVPTLGIYGPTNPLLQGPYGDKNLTVVKEDLDCLYCNLLECPIGNLCMVELAKDSLIAKFNELIAINNIKF
ncbi:MAG: glycosyltransferase family 9 protein [Ignavibacteriae bacterium]|nr:glycosyltransferase family 9 protein [Ignavibacteriota bacterium]